MEVVLAVAVLAAVGLIFRELTFLSLVLLMVLVVVVAQTLLVVMLVLETTLHIRVVLHIRKQYLKALIIQVVAVLQLLETDKQRIFQQVLR